jgi:hypothetical protein
VWFLYKSDPILGIKGHIHNQFDCHNTLIMEIKGEAKLLRIFISSTDKFKHTPLYEMLVFAVKRYGLAGATVLRGVMGYGSSS